MISNLADAVPSNEYEMSTLISVIALACFTWYFFILLVQCIGIFQLWVERQFCAMCPSDYLQVPLLLVETETRRLSNVKDRLRCLILLLSGRSKG